MDLHISLAGRGDLTARIYAALRDAIRDGHLRPGDRLPPTRDLARSLQVARNTVALAYERLIAEGFLHGRAGAGTFVTTPPAAVGRRRRESPATGLRPRAGWTYEPTTTSSEQAAPRYDFRIGIPDPELFPFDTWRRLLASEVRLRANSPGTYAEPAGLLSLREAISRYVGYARSVQADPDDIVVTNGTQQALDLIARVLVSPGDVVAVEEPGYLPARARLVYVTPSHQFPLGTAMSLNRRRELLAWAAGRSAAVVEDDYDSEFRFSARPLDPLQSLDTTGRVLYVGTFSKTLLPGLRVGFVVAPATLRGALRAARQLSDGHGHIATQAALARFMDEGQLGRHIRKAAKVYAERHDEIVRTISGDLGDLLELVPSSAGLHVCARLRSGGPALAEEVVAELRGKGVAVEALADYYRDLPAEAGFVLGYGAARSSTVRKGLTIFGAALRRRASAS